MNYKYVQSPPEFSRRKDKINREHVLLAAKAIGRPLKGSEQVHHLDENKANNNPNNLVVCPDMSYHRLLHMRQDAYEASGHYHYMKCPYCKEYDDPQNMYVRPNARQAWHHSCAAKYKRTPNPKTGPYRYMKGNKYDV